MGARICGVNLEFDTLEWSVLFDSIRSPPDNPRLRGAMALNISLVSSDASVKARFFSSANFSPTA